MVAGRLTSIIGDGPLAPITDFGDFFSLESQQLTNEEIRVQPARRLPWESKREFGHLDILLKTRIAPHYSLTALVNERFRPLPNFLFVPNRFPSSV